MFKTMGDQIETHPIILFDGICNFCNSAVNFIIDRDPSAYFVFAPLQSNIGQSLLKQHGLSQIKLNSVVLIDEGRCYTKSTAALRIASRLTGLWRLCRIAIIVPRPVRDLLYDFIARNRNRWFGVRDSCRLPEPEIARRFICGVGLCLGCSILYLCLSVAKYTS